MREKKTRAVRETNKIAVSHFILFSLLEARARFELAITVLQTDALTSLATEPYHHTSLGASFAAAITAAHHFRQGGQLHLLSLFIPFCYLSLEGEP